MREEYDIAIIGSGFGGSLLAMIARRFGRSVILIEKGTHPRVAIGESSTPLSNLLLEDLAERYKLPELAPLTKWGSWQRSYPELACGLKRGFTFHHHVLGEPRRPAPDRRDQLLVAASPHDGIADTHWYRADFDHFLLRQAQMLGADYVDQTGLRHFVDEGDAASLTGERRGLPVRVRARFVVDATGPRGFLHRALGLGELNLPGLSSTQGLYSHFSGVKRLGEGAASRTGEAPPYPIDDAAVHHVFDGGWVWVLQFNNGITSAGVAATDEVAAQLGLAEGEKGWRRLLGLIPALEEQFISAQAQRPFTHVPRLGFRTARAAGDNWALLPSAAGFVDPLLSTGFPLTLLGISRLAEAIERDWGTDRFTGGLAAYAKTTDAELTAASRLVGALYASMNDFPLFVALSLLYFAIVSYAEAARRLGKPELAPSFLMHDHPVFEPACRQLLDRARGALSLQESARLVDDIVNAIQPFNVAGLGDPGRRNWYPVLAEDLLASAHKLHASREDILRLLHRCGFERDADAVSPVSAQL